MRTLIDAVDRVTRCQSHDQLVRLFERRGDDWRRSLPDKEFLVLAETAKQRGKRLEHGEVAVQH